VDFASIASVSGAGQQHGSVYWARGSERQLKELNPEKTLAEQLQNAFSIKDSPIWMDSSTSDYCRKLEKIVGGPEKLAAITGSRGYERFTGNQIAKIAENWSDKYENSERISLVSSFMSSIFVGHYAPIDYSDASGMNIMDIHSKDWNQTILDGIGKNLRERLGQPVNSNTTIGPIASYFVERYGFSKDCQVVAFTGDNPSSLAGMRLSLGDLAVSLGTSDTLFLSLGGEAKPHLFGHIFCSPVDVDAYMALLCYMNGSLTREWARDKYANGSWDVFNQFLEKTEPGNGGNLGIYYVVPEITPTNGSKIKRYNSEGGLVTEFEDKAIEIRALVESHFLALRSHSEKMGFQVNSRLLVTGGASSNHHLIQVLADIFGVPVYVLEDISNSASLGGCYRGYYGISKSTKSFSKTLDSLGSVEQKLTLGAKPNLGAHQIYNQLITSFVAFEEANE